MVKPSNRSGQRGRRKSWRTMRGRFGSSRIESPARATVPAATAPRRNWRLVIGRADKRTNSAGIDGIRRPTSSITQRTVAEDYGRDSRGRHADRSGQSGGCAGQVHQKLNCACRSMRRTATPVENGPPKRLLYLSKNGDPRTPPGLARFTLLNRLRADALSVRL